MRGWGCAIGTVLLLLSINGVSQAAPNEAPSPKPSTHVSAKPPKSQPSSHITAPRPKPQHTRPQKNTNAAAHPRPQDVPPHAVHPSPQAAHPNMASSKALQIPARKPQNDKWWHDPHAQPDGHRGAWMAHWNGHPMIARVVVVRHRYTPVAFGQDPDNLPMLENGPNADAATLSTGRAYTTPGNCTVEFVGDRVKVHEPHEIVTQNGTAPCNWQVYGDPHVINPDGTRFDFKRPSGMFTLEDGTRLVVIARGPRDTVSELLVLVPGGDVTGFDLNLTTDYGHEVGGEFHDHGTVAGSAAQDQFGTPPAGH